jgi:hypothetical protein
MPPCCIGRSRLSRRRLSVASCSSAWRESRTATRSDGRSCSQRRAVHCRPTKLPLRTRLLSWMAHAFGPGAILPMLLAEEGREVQAYLGMARETSHRSAHQAAIDIASDSAVHARELSEMMGREGEPWHTGGAGGMLRSVVYGFNDGLTANFGLVAGIVGARCRAAYRDHQRCGGRARRCAVDGIERLPCGQERAGGPGAPDRDGAGRDAADAGTRGGGARSHLRGQRVCRGSARARPRTT